MGRGRGDDRKPFAETLASEPRAAVSGDGATVSAQPEGLEQTVASDAGPPQAVRVIDRRASAPTMMAAGSSTRDPDYDDLQPVAPEHYILDGTLAKGGMGQILRARDRRLGRAVAIKELRAVTPDTVARFRREVKITARLQHPAIVAVHEAGVWPSGEPFFAMEMIAGRPLDVVIAGTKTWQERVVLLPHVLAVADALAYAHSRGVIHRDLKPANVLVGEFGETIVIDWGLARDLFADDVTGTTPLPRGGVHETVVGAVLGTPAYMPPEQARGERVDEKADVYSIGAMLYHLLAGKAPYAGASVEEILARVMAKPPLPLAQLAPEAPSDLVAIVEKAMSRELADRYPSGRALADDLRRFQSGQLVGAHRYTRGERLRRFVRKNRIALAVAGAALVVLAAVGAFSVSRIVDERDAAEDARELAASQRDAAEKLVGFMLADLKPSLERVGRLDVMGGVSKEVDAYYSTLGAAKGADAIATSRRAEAVRTLGDVLDASGDVDGAQRSYEHAVAMLESQPSPDPVALAAARTDLGMILQVKGELDQASAALERANQALAASATDRSARAALVRAKHARWQGIVAFARAEYPQALVALDRAVTLGVAAVKAHPTARDLRFELSKAYDRRTDTHNAMSNLANALADARASLALREQLEREDPQDLPVRRAIAVSWDKLFNLAINEERLGDAEHAATRQIEILEGLVRHDPSNHSWMLNLVIALARPADLAFERGDYPEAVRRQERVVTVARQLADLDRSNLEARIELGKAITKLGERVLAAGDIDRSLSTMKDALAMFEQLANEFPADPLHAAMIGDIQEIIGSAHFTRGDATAAADAFGKAVERAEAQLRATNSAREKANVATKQVHYGRALANIAARNAEGIALMQRAIASMRELERAKELSPYDVAMIAELEKLAKDYRMPVQKKTSTSRPQ